MKKKKYLLCTKGVTTNVTVTHPSCFYQWTMDQVQLQDVISFDGMICEIRLVKHKHNR
jgi:hypothetical protein